jgi:hypothetical protein
MDAQTGGLQMFFQHQKSRSNAENTGREPVIDHFKNVENLGLDPSLVPASYLPHF